MAVVSIITACSRPQNLKKIYDSIDFHMVNKWYIIYDTSKCRTYEFQFPLEPKILELTCDKQGFAGHPQINFALELTKGQDGFMYIMDDDNIFHEHFWKLLPTLDPEMVYTWDQNRIQENRIMKGGKIEEEKIDTSQFIVPRSLIGNIKWADQRSAGDFRFISQIFKRHEEKFRYIPEIACYHNFIKKIKVAICFFGLTRSLKFTLPSIEKYLLGPLKQYGIKHDIYLHTYKTKKPYTNPRAGENGVTLDNNEYKLLEPKRSIVEDKELVSKRIGLERYRAKGDPWGQERSAIPGDFTTLDNHILYLWSQKQLTSMWLQGGNYSHIIMCRPDVLYQVPIQLDWFSFTSDKICIPNFGLCGNVNDRFALGRPEQMKPYGSRFDEALAYSKRHQLASEAYLIATMKKHKIKYEHVAFYFIRVRANMEKNGMDIGQIGSLTRKKRGKKTRKNKGIIEISSL